MTPRRASFIRIGGVKVRKRAIAVFAASIMTLGGMVIAAALPALLAIDARLITAEECITGLLVGLMIAFVGNGTIPLLTPSRRKVPRSMTNAPTPSTGPVVQAVIPGRGYHSKAPDVREDLSVVFTYRRDRPYSILMDIAQADPYDGSFSNAVRWEVSRETLYEGMTLGRSSGVGDFSASMLGTRRMLLSLSGTGSCTCGTEHHYDMHLNYRTLCAFLARTAECVPLGQESGFLDIDGQLERMFA